MKDVIRLLYFSEADEAKSMESHDHEDNQWTEVVAAAEYCGTQIRARIQDG